MAKDYALWGAFLWIVTSLPAVWFVEWQISWFPDWHPIARFGWLAMLAYCAVGPALLFTNKDTNHDR